ncbi:MAG: nuclear transport factor 2 family protein [Ignavibacteria bacterium]|nr:nuclear transport factor 2 family protein [Ignavibacteria bacterium]MBT8382134.1 nuclear transport factor 2 family protein [Ignavibacteria bacterium]NNJ53964.1 nuclear transport factor 2 family protein [Ignavibacteriaceae bacterium]NNL22494.1 nuclear transport factor 2 family protein [Ignavibacteriaceae bacterium]
MQTATEKIVEKDRIKEVINNLFIFTDNSDWAAVEKCFAEKVHFDMTSMGAESTIELEPKQITDMWDDGLKNLDAVHHQTGNFKIDVSKEKAVVFCYGIASHFKKTASDKNTRTFVGSYNFHLIKNGDDWKVDSLKFNLKYVEGNLSLESN